MDFGRLPQVDHVSFTLPPLDKRTNRVLENNQEPGGRKKLKVFWGCPAWGRKDWLGKLYPRNAQEKDFLKLYSRQFNSIELNSTHYRIPDAPTISRWYEQTAPDFVFCPKFPQNISHVFNPALAQKEAVSFCEAVTGLKEKLGLSFLQFPPGFAPTQLGQLRELLVSLPLGFRLVVEFRHQDFFKARTLIHPAFELLNQFGVGTVITDVAGRRDLCHGTLTTKSVFIRFVGDGLHPFDYARVDDWMRTFKEWVAQGLEEIYFFSHQPDDFLSPELLSYFVKGMGRECQLELKDWTPVSVDLPKPAPPAQLSLI